MGSGAAAIHRHTAWGQWAVELPQITASLPCSSGQGNSCGTPPHCLGALGTRTPLLHHCTAWGQWAVELPKYTAELPSVSGPLDVYCTLPHCLGAVGSGTPASHRLTAWGSGHWNSCVVWSLLCVGVHGVLGTLALICCERVVCCVVSVVHVCARRPWLVGSRLPCVLAVRCGLHCAPSVCCAVWWLWCLGVQGVHGSLALFCFVCMVCCVVFEVLRCAWRASLCMACMASCLSFALCVVRCVSLWCVAAHSHGVDGSLALVRLVLVVCCVAYVESGCARCLITGGLD